MGRSGARFVMLGTPNQGSHQIVETLLGKSDLIRKLTRIDSSHAMQQILTIMAGFPACFSFCPSPASGKPAMFSSVTTTSRRGSGRS